MQLEVENPYASPQALVEAVSEESTVSLTRGVYYAFLWGLVVLPVPMFLAILQKIFRPELPPPLLLRVSFTNFHLVAVSLLALPAFCGLVAIANYTSRVKRSYLLTFLFFCMAYVAGGITLGIVTELTGGPLVKPRRNPPISDQEFIWNVCCFLVVLTLFCILLTTWRIAHSKRHHSN